MVFWYVWYGRPWAYYINCVLWSNVCYMGLSIHWFHDLEATILIGLVTTGWMSLVGVGHSGSDSIMPLMLHTVCCVIIGVLALYYRSLVTVSTPLRQGNISTRPCVRVMTYKALDFFALKQLLNYRWFYTIEL